MTGFPSAPLQTMGKPGVWPQARAPAQPTSTSPRCEIMSAPAPRQTQSSCWGLAAGVLNAPALDSLHTVLSGTLTLWGHGRG